MVLPPNRVIGRRTYLVSTTTGNIITIENDVRNIIPRVVDDPKHLYKYFLTFRILYSDGVGDQAIDDTLKLYVGPAGGSNQMLYVDDYGAINTDNLGGIVPAILFVQLDEESVAGIFADFANWGALETHTCKLYVQIHEHLVEASQEHLLDRSS